MVSIPSTLGHAIARRIKSLHTFTLPLCFSSPSEIPIQFCNPRCQTTDPCSSPLSAPMGCIFCWLDAIVRQRYRGAQTPVTSDTLSPRNKPCTCSDQSINLIPSAICMQDPVSGPELYPPQLGPNPRRSQRLHKYGEAPASPHIFKFDEHVAVTACSNLGLAEAGVCTNRKRGGGCRNLMEMDAGQKQQDIREIRCSN